MIYVSDPDKTDYPHHLIFQIWFVHVAVNMATKLKPVTPSSCGFKMHGNTVCVSKIILNLSL